MRLAGAPLRALGVIGILCALLSACDDAQDERAGPATVPTGPAMPGLATECPAKDTPLPYPPDGVLPEGAVGVRLCNTVEASGKKRLQFDVHVPADELTSGLETLTDIGNSGSAPGPDASCTLEAGPDLVYWFRYADNSAHAVAYQRYGCRWLRIGPDDVTDTGGAFHVAFVERLATQRADTTPPARTPRADCDRRPTTALDLSESLDLAAAVLCIGSGSGTYEVVARFTSDELSLLNADYDPSSREGSKRCRKHAYWMISGYTAWADRIELYGDGCTFYVPLERHSVVWRLTPDVQDMLTRLAGEKAAPLRPLS